jgi:molecular chaperone DnaK
MPARNQWVASPERTVRSIKRKMGTKEKVSMAGKEYLPQEIAAFILRELKFAAEKELGMPLKKAVITVPAYFNEVQRKATMEAGEIAGLEVERIINEPTAAALAYGYGVQEKSENLQIMVYDLGGGTFDVSIIELHEGIVDVIATAGNNLLGGDDFDELLAGYLADEFMKEHDIDLRDDHQAWARLLRAAEEAKIQLSFDQITEIELEYIIKDDSGNPLHLSQELERSEFEYLIEDLIEETITCISEALKDADLSEKDIDRILFVGGSTRIPMVRKMVEKRMKKEPHLEINPDEAVALGASVQAGIIAKEEIDTILVDVTPLSLGIETAQINFMGKLKDDVFEPLIERNTTIPVHKSKQFTTLYPGQKSIHIKVYQGEEKTASKNVMLGDFMVDDLKPNIKRNGLAVVTVNFSLDINGILEVTVTDRGSGKKTKEKLEAKRQRLSPEEIAKSQAKLAGASKATPEAVGLGEENQALIERAQKLLSEKEVDQELAENIQDAIDNIYKAAKEDKSEEIEEYSDELIDLLMEAEA